MRRLLKKILNAAGLDVRLRSNMRKAAKRDAQAAWAERWRFVLNHQIKTVIDVGANQGQFALMIHSLLPDAEIISFEPLGSIYRQLVDNTAHIDSIRTFNLALGDEAGRVRMFHNAQNASSSLLEMTDLHRRDWPKSAETTVEDVEVVALDDALSDLLLTPDVLLKIDVQGYEDRVLRGAERTVAQSRLVVPEVTFYPLYEGQALFADIHAIMAAQGLTYRGNVEQYVSPIDHNVLYADAVYERSPGDRGNDVEPSGDAQR